ncbi:MAG TPA: alpha/beta fold hydrolase [Gemmatimonadaceae bacterium]|nr:alpha/beta fold hydrolase [Gemmatimonadaceae bacterium]
MKAQCDDAHTISFEDRGDGVPVLFVHGFPHDRALWDPQLDALSDRARCIAPDLRGFGESGHEGPWSMDRHAADLACLLDHLRIERVVLCGLSMGGYVSFAFWRRYSDRVRALVLCDTRPGPDSDEARGKRRQLMEVARREGATAVAEGQMEQMVGRTTHERRPEVVAGVRRMLERAPVEGIVGALEAMVARPDSTPDLSTIDVPTLIVVGEEDTLTPPDEARRMHEAIAGSRLEVIGGAGHVSNVENPDAFNRALGDFLSSLG